MDKFGAELNWSLPNRIALREHPSADAVARFENSDGNSGARKVNGSGHTGRSGAYHDDTMSFRHDKRLDSESIRLR